MLYAVLIAVLVALDQVVKFWVRTNIPEFGSLPLIPRALELTFVKNTGAAFSIFKDHTGLLTIVSAVVAVAIAVVLLRKMISHPFGVLPLSVVLAGALGNLIDRMFFGYVTDMFNVLFMRFAVFNVADICVVIGGAAFCVYFLFFFEKLEKKEQPDGTNPAES